MKKLLLALPFVVGGSWAGVSYFTGTQTQDAYEQLLSQANELGFVVLVNEQYSAGVVNSTAITNVMESAEPDAPVLFRLQHAIQHSPVGLNEGAMRVGAAIITTTLLQDDSIPESMQAFMQGFGTEEPIQLDTDVKFDGAMAHRLLVSSYEHQYDDVSVRFGGVDYAMASSSDALKGEGSTGELVVTSDDTVVRLAAGEIQNELLFNDDSISSGGYSITFDKLTATGPQVPVSLALKKISLGSSLDVQNDKLGMETRYSIGSIDSPLPISRASLVASTTQMSLEGMKSYYSAASDLANSDASAEQSDEQIRALLLAAVDIIGPGTGMTYELDLGNEGGNANFVATAKVVDSTSEHFPAAGLVSITTLREALNALELDVNLDADAAAIDQTPVAIALGMPEAEQFIVADGITYKSDISLRNLVVDINGDPLSLEMVLGEMLDMPLASLLDSMQ